MEMIAEALAIVGVIACAALVFVFWAALPVVIPLQFDMYGNISSYGPRSELLKPLAIGLLIYILLTIVIVFRERIISIFRLTNRLSPKKFSIYRAMIAWFKAEIVWSCALLEVVPISAAFYNSHALTMILPLPAVIFVLTILYYGATLIRPTTLNS